MAYKLSQINQSGIPPLLKGIASYEQWVEKLTAIRKIWFDYIGELPASVSVRLKINSQSKNLGHTRGA